MLSYLLALLEILVKFWAGPNRLKVIQKLSNAEKFVLLVTANGMIGFVIWLLT